MTQNAAVFLEQTVVQFELPAAADEVLPGIPWGAVDAFPTPAYWAYQVLARRVTGQNVRYRLGETFAEEVAACLLGGHGIPANVGVAAFHRLKSAGLLVGTPCEELLNGELSKPMDIYGRACKYRFARQKSRYLATALARLAEGGVPTDCAKALREWLRTLPGVGPKTASWIVRNWLDSDDVAILDIHILRAGAVAGFFGHGLTVDHDYLELEEQFLQFSHAIGVRASELDAVMWLEMMSSPASTRKLMKRKETQRSAALQRTRAHQGSAHPNQSRLLD
jgi:N-glycosylase/DNA lyase